jgi:hypothetical protein
MKAIKVFLAGVVLVLAANSASAQTVSIVSGNGQVACQLCFTANPKSGFDPLTVKVVDALGRPLANATVNWVLSSGSGSIASAQTNTDASGLTANNYYSAFTPLNLFNIPFLQGTVVASTGNSSVTFTETQVLVNQQNPAASQINIGIPYGQQLIGPAGGISAVPLSVTVISALGAGVPGVAITLTTDDPAGGPTVACQTQAGQAPGVALTDATGTANCNLQFGPVIGNTGTFKVVVGGGYLTTAPLNFTVTVGPPGLIQIINGNRQTAGAPGTPLPAPFLAKVADLGGNPVGGADVTWTVIPASAATLTAVRSPSDVAGLVSAIARIGAANGPFQVRVALATNPAIVAVFDVSAPAVTISGLNKQSGDNQDAAQNSAFSSPLVVQALSGGQPVSGVAVNFAVTSGSATLSAAAATTNSQGQAQVTANAGPTVGPVVVTASAGTFSVIFNLTVRPPGPAFTSDSFYNAFSLERGSISPCSLATIIAGGLAPGITGTVSAPLYSGLPVPAGG